MRKSAQDLRQKSAKEMNKEIDQIRAELAKLRLEMKTNPPKDTNVIVKKRKRLAILLTILGENQEKAENPKNA